AAVPERSLEQRDRLAFSDKPNGLRDGEVEFVHMADQYSRPEKFARDVTHLVTRVEPGLRTGTHFRQFRPKVFQPQTALALQARQHPRFAEPRLSCHRKIHGITPSPCARA